ncbi:MAG TPA: Gfo/Idh/MocA family oxidoreductase [Fimbriimonas sp.]
MVRVGILSSAHLHVWSYVSALKAHPQAEVIGAWDDEVERGETFAQQSGIPFVGYLENLLDAVDAVVIVSENKRHAEMAEWAAKAGKHILCEKPLVTTNEEADRMRRAVEAGGVKLMTAFPCRYSPAYTRLKERVAAGEIGKIRAVCATNHGRCPFSWFVETEKSGGGALVDHVVHVGDLLRDLLQADPVRVTAQTGHNMYGQDWDDTAMATLEFPDGVFATIDSSWSRPPSYKTWGDVTLNVVGDEGVIELDMFGQEVQHYRTGQPTHVVAGYGSNMDALLVDDFVRCCLGEREVAVSMEDGIQASRIFMAGYRSVEEVQPISLSAG